MNCVPLSVSPSNAWFVTKRKKVMPSYTTWKMIYPSFITRRMVSWGRLLIPEIKKLRICPACVGQLRLSVAMCVQLCICLRVYLLACSRQRSSPNFIHGYRDQFGEELIRFSRSWGQRWTHLRKSTSGKTKEEVDRQRQGGLQPTGVDAHRSRQSCTGSTSMAEHRTQLGLPAREDYIFVTKALSQK